MRVLGLDGCPGGWVAVVLENGRFAEAGVARTISESLGAFGDVAAAGVDMPIGLPARGKRRSDEEARTFVGPRQNSVFWTPPLEAIEAETQAEAVQACRRLEAPGISAQCWALQPKIFEARKAAKADLRVFEVHPEVSFRAMSPGPLGRKKSWDGLMERLDLLAAEGVELPKRLGLGAGVAVDDVVDAAAVAWSAWRYGGRMARTLPAKPTAEELRGRLVIWY